MSSRQRWRCELLDEPGSDETRRVQALFCRNFFEFSLQGRLHANSQAFLFGCPEPKFHCDISHLVKIIRDIMRVPELRFFCERREHRNFVSSFLLHCWYHLRSLRFIDRAVTT